MTTGEKIAKCRKDAELKRRRKRVENFFCENCDTPPEKSCIISAYLLI